MNKVPECLNNSECREILIGAQVNLIFYFSVLNIFLKLNF